MIAAQGVLALTAPYLGSDPLLAYAAVKTAHRLDPLDRKIRHHLYLTAVNASDRLNDAEVVWAERVAATSMPYQSRHLILKAYSLIECCPREAETIVSHLEHRRIGGHVVTDLRKRLENR